MNEAAYFVQDRALTLIGDAKIHPATYPAAIRWLDLAGRWAEKRGLPELRAAIRAARFKILTRSFDTRHNHEHA